ncbi:MAG: ribosome biogenesis GTPase YlqF [Clostridia bacterium]|nr:ribosome biogenesis GTPase YlqF [Clostridia bacterium]
MPSETIQWFPGHMAKTRRMITENLKHVDLVIEILDARIPYSSRNPEIARLTENKPTLLLLNKASLADPAQDASWVKRYTNENTFCLLTDCVTGEGMNQLAPTIKRILAEKLRRYEEKGMTGRRVRAMVLGVPNVGKSSLINRICGNKKTKVENRPGVTLDKQWVTTSVGVDLLDMPGILWPKFEERRVGENLALTGAIRDGVLDLEALAVILCKRLRRLYPELLSTRYKLGDMEAYRELSDYDLFLAIGKKRGFLVSGGEINTERTANTLIEEFRSAKIGRITLDRYSKEELPDA